jgi:hypothetical protein
VFTNEYLKVDKFVSGLNNPSFHSIKTTIIADNAVDGKMNNPQCTIVYANKVAVSLGLFSSTSDLSPRFRTDMTDSEEPTRGSGRPGGGRGRVHDRGHGRTHNGFAQGN